MKRSALFILLGMMTLGACRSAPRHSSGPPPIPSGLSVRGQLPGRLDLSDGSRWQVQPAGQSASLRWRPRDPVRVVRSGHPAWPFLLIHSPSRTAALARPAPSY
ncbi:MAG TPA: hypothetical protein VHM91_18355 [Verrucomicrobiales bacterium]|nr:hypothetical protein [Verrucomicrobiales bacterium]